MRKAYEPGSNEVQTETPNEVRTPLNSSFSSSSSSSPPSSSSGLTVLPGRAITSEVEQHTHESRVREKSATRSTNGHKSKFDYKTIAEYAWASRHWALRWNRCHPSEKQLEPIRNPDAWATSAFKLGMYDTQIEEFVNDREGHRFNR